MVSIDRIFEGIHKNALLLTLRGLFSEAGAGSPSEPKAGIVSADENRRHRDVPGREKNRLASGHVAAGAIVRLVVGPGGDSQAEDIDQCSWCQKGSNVVGS